jgi:hypothetical protein
VIKGVWLGFLGGLEVLARQRGVGDDGFKEAAALSLCYFSAFPSSPNKSLTLLSNMRSLFKTLLTAALALPLVQALPKVTRTGKYLYDDTGARFFIKVCSCAPC